MYDIIVTILALALIVTQTYSVLMILRSEKKLNIYENWIVEFRERVQMTYKTMKEVDIRGSFEADDEVGDVFKAIQQLVNDLNDIVSDENETNTEDENRL